MVTDDSGGDDVAAIDEPLPGQSMLFGENEDFIAAWQQWKGMPRFDMDDLTSVLDVVVHFRNLEDARSFEELVGQKLPTSSWGIWYPKLEIAHFGDKRYRSVVDEPPPGSAILADDWTDDI